MAMRTLVLQGSPRRDGDTAALCRVALEALGGEADILWAYDGDIAPCIDCRHCWTHAGCVYDDAFQRAVEGIARYGAVIVASPLYFSELSGVLLAAASRLQQVYAGYAFRGEAKPVLARAGGIILAGGGDGGAEPAEARGRLLLSLLGAAHVGTVLAHDTNRTPARDDCAAMDAARWLGKAMAASKTLTDFCRGDGEGSA